MPLRQQKYKKHIPGFSQKRVRFLSGWSYAPRYSCRSKAKVNCFLHTKKRYASKTIRPLKLLEVRPLKLLEVRG